MPSPRRETPKTLTTRDSGGTRKPTATCRKRDRSASPPRQTRRLPDGNSAGRPLRGRSCFDGLPEAACMVRSHTFVTPARAPARAYARGCPITCPRWRVLKLRLLSPEGTTGYSSGREPRVPARVPETEPQRGDTSLNVRMCRPSGACFLLFRFAGFLFM